MPEVDRLQIVLDADTGEYVRDMDDAEKATREFAEESEKATLQNIEMMVALEGLSGGLNQVVGGYSKSIASAQQLGIVNEQQYKTLEKFRYQMELVAGPMEVVIALNKLDASTKILLSQATATQSATTKGATVSQWGLNTAMMASPIFIIGATIVALIVILYALEKKFGLVTKSVDALNDAFSKGADEVQRYIDLANDLGDSLIGAVEFVPGKVSGLINEIHGGR